MRNHIDEYLEWKAISAPVAAKSYERWLVAFSDIAGEKDIEEIDLKDWTQYHQWLQSKYAAGSIELAMVAVRNFFKFLHRQGHEVLHPDFIKFPRKKQRKMKMVTPADYEAIMDTFADVSDEVHMRDNLILRMLWDTGVRVGELVALNVNGLDLRERSAVIETEKAGTIRQIFWTEDTNDLIVEYLRKRGDDAKSQPLFISYGRNVQDEAKRLSQRSIQYLVKERASIAGIDNNLTPHGFRHSWAKRKRDLGCPLPFIQKGLGHSSLAATQVYTSYSDPDYERMAKKYMRKEKRNQIPLNLQNEMKEILERGGYEFVGTRS